MARQIPESLHREISRINADMEKMDKTRLSLDAQSGIQLFEQALKNSQGIRPEELKQGSAVKKALTSMVFNPNNRSDVLEILDEVITGKNKDRNLINDFEHLGNQYRIPENTFANIKQDEELSKLISESRSTLTQRLADAVLKKAAKENAQIKAFYDFPEFRSEVKFLII
jgi:hypothetical protein